MHLPLDVGAAFESKRQQATPTRRRSRRLVTSLLTAGLAVGAAACSSTPAPVGQKSAALSDESDAQHTLTAYAQVVATGIAGAGAICEVGPFNPGSPFGASGAFTGFTQPGNVLASRRLLVASTSNYGAPLGNPAQYAGSVLSIDPSGGAFEVPADFAAAGGQASGAGGRVIVYTANNAAFSNSVYHPTVVTAAFTGAALLTGISINSGNGRPWFSNAPTGSNGEGTITVIDPNGAPLNAAPDAVAGGVFAGNETNRNAASTHGLVSGTLGTAIFTKSPDLTGKAVFAALEADGSVVQIHVAKGVDGLAPPGTVTPVDGVSPAAMESTDPSVIAREGILFNWVPTRNLFIADPQANRLVVLDVSDDGVMFSATSRTIESRAFNMPIDLAPTTREVAAANFASNSTLGGGSDLYVLNRGDNSIVRMRIDGTVIARRAIAAAVDGFRVNGIAVSQDGQLIYVTATTPNHGGVVLSLSAFGAPDTTSQFFATAFGAGATDMNGIGSVLFALNATPDQGLGPLFNGQSCNSCHETPFAGGMGTLPGQHEFLFGMMTDDGTFLDHFGQGGPVARAHSVSELGVSCGLPTGVPPEANVTSQRNAMTLRGNGLMDDIVLGDVVKNMNLEPADVRGRPNLLADGRMGKFGWKANVATLVEFMGDAYRNEIGLTNSMAPNDLVHGCGADQNSPELDALPLQAQAAFLNNLDPVPQTADAGATCRATPGYAVFQAAGCAGCHSPTLPGRGIKVPLYSDLLLHDMGAGLADGLPQESATGSEFRTMTLWKLSERTRFLHDARATTVDAAVAAHGGQAAASAAAFAALSDSDHQALLAFLGCI
ncbi:MAG TPA: di-heme oxidoredictase family protein [Polyangia bacterium]|jgi:hypothetical protein|nr:di-heme oxidoredictase family protein [Polyangia bacterium]